MKGLLLKDIYTITKQMKIFLAVIVIWTLIPGFSGSSFAIFYTGMLPVTALAYDERSKWHTLAAMMPYSTTSLVVSKYVLGYILVFLTSLLSLAAQVVISFTQGVTLGFEDILPLLISFSAALIFVAVNLPFMFRLGVERGRYIFLMLIAAFVVVMIMLGSPAAEVFQRLIISPGLLTTLFFAIALVLNAISIVCAIRFYKNRSA